MRNKKVSIIISAIFVLIFVITLGYFFQKYYQRDILISDQEVKQQCSYPGDKEAYEAAMNEQSLDICVCIEDKDAATECKLAVTDVNLYQQALSQFDVNICEEIGEEEAKKACLEVVSQSIAFFDTNDPERLARIQAVSQSSEAVESLERVISNDPSNIENLIALSLAYSERGLREQEAGNDQTPYVQKALETIKKAKEIDANDTNVYRAEGYAYEIQPDYFRAIDSYNKAIELDSNNAMAYAGRAHASNLAGLLDKALEDFEKASEIDKNNEISFIYSNLCRLQASREDLNNKAVANCNKVINLNNVDVDSMSVAYQVLADIYKKREDYTQAEKYLLLAISVFPSDGNIYVNTSELYFLQGDYEKAIEEANKAIRLTPNKVAGFYALARAYYGSENYEQAIVIAQRGIELVDSDVSLLASSKPLMKRDLYYVIAYSFERMGNEEKFNEFDKMAKDLGV